MMRLILSLFIMCLFSVNTFAASKCVYAPSDMKGKIVGVGRTPAEAFEDAATKCFEARKSFFESRKNKNLDEDSGLSLIDECANLNCQS